MRACPLHPQEMQMTQVVILSEAKGSAFPGVRLLDERFFAFGSE